MYVMIDPVLRGSIDRLALVESLDRDRPLDAMLVVLFATIVSPTRLLMWPQYSIVLEDSQQA
jgi:hypothetical protein